MTTPPLVELVASRWGDWFPDQARAPLRFGFLASPAVDPPRGVVLVFTGPGAYPVAAIKVALADDGFTSLENEYMALEALAPERELLGFEIPRAIDLIATSGGGLAVFSAIRGELLPAIYLKRHYGSGAARRFLNTAYDVGESLRQTSRSSSESGVIVWSDRMEEFARTFSLDASDKARVKSFERELDADGFSSRACRQHGDLAYGNVLSRGASIGVVDWEKSGTQYPGWYDFVYSALSLALLGSSRDSTDIDVGFLLDHRRSVGRALRIILEARWRESISFRRASVLTAAQAALSSRQLGRSGAERWARMVIALIDDRAWAAQAPWLAASSGHRSAT